MTIEQMRNVDVRTVDPETFLSGKLKRILDLTILTNTNANNSINHL